MTPLELSTAFIEAFNERDRDTMWSLLDEDTTFTVGGAEPFTGIEAVKAYYAQVFDSPGELRAHIVSGVEEGDIVFVENRLEGTLPDGRAFTIEQAVRHQWRDGLLVAYRNYNDQPQVGDEQIGFEELLAMMAEQT